MFSYTRTGGGTAISDPGEAGCSLFQGEYPIAQGEDEEKERPEGTGIYRHIALIRGWRASSELFGRAPIQVVAPTDHLLVTHKPPP